tara:strand:+ start:2768 stop:4690 length:1923 start_codon:yes stop_codon:yes gene_type:complete
MKDKAYFKSAEASPKEQKFLNRRKFIEKLDHVDKIWDFLEDKCGDKLAVKDLRGESKKKLTYSELSNYIKKASKAFFKLNLKKSDVVTVISENSPKWLIVDQGLMRIGAINAVRGCNSPAVELDYIINHSKSVGLVVQSREVWLKLSNKSELIKNLKFIVVLEGDSFAEALNWNEFIALGEKVILSEYLSQVRNSNINDIASILYTSGTTGKPKGVPLTHSNFLHQIINLACIADPNLGTSVLSVLPIWHSYERSAEYFFFSCGCSQYYTTPKFLKEDIKKIKPEVMATVPRLWEAIHDGFFLALQKMPKGKQKVLKFLLKKSSVYKKNIRKVKNLEISVLGFNSKLIAFFKVVCNYPIHRLSSLFLWPSILKQLCGDKLIFPINGGGALPEHVDLFFESLGIDLLVGYGLTETSPVLTCRRTWANVRGSSGQPLPSTEVKIVDDKNSLLNLRETGRILVRGPQVMKGYLYDDIATSKVLSSDGWFDTGDLGFLIPNGSLVINGRSKDTIVLSSGENIEPNPLETQILASDLIQQVQLVGQDKKQLAALIVPNLEYIELNYYERDLNKINENKIIRNFFKLKINNLLKNRIGYRIEEQIINCFFVQPFTIENGLLTQTLKQKRKEINILYTENIEEMYKK